MNLVIKAHEEDPPLASSLEYLKRDLSQNPFWHDLQGWVKGRIGLHQQVCEESTDMMQIRHSQGIIANCRDILDLPEMWISEREAEKHNEENDA